MVVLQGIVTVHCPLMDTRTYGHGEELEEKEEEEEEEEDYSRFFFFFFFTLATYRPNVWTHFPI